MKRTKRMKRNARPEAKWLVRAYYPSGERLEAYPTEAEAWAATKRHVRNGVAVAGPSGRLDPDDLRAKLKTWSATADNIDDFDVLHRKWTLKKSRTSL
jgi:hypothetical protein